MISPEQTMNAIAEQGLCAGCGLCQAVAGKHRIRFTRSVNGYERPVVVGELDQQIVDKLFDVCPGTRIDGLPQREIHADTVIDRVWGPWLRMARAWAGNEQQRYEGSTGGVLTALASFLLAENWVDFILHVKASDQFPTFGQAHLSFTQADVLAAAGSRYGPSAPLIDIEAVLSRGKPFAFIGKPCDISALRNLSRHDERVDELVRFWLTPVCGGYMPPQSMDDFLRKDGLQPGALTAFRYRGRGCPGPTRLQTADETREYHYLDFWGEDASAWQLPFRCKVCADGIGEAADIAASDTWPGGSPDRQESENDPGVNGVIVRTRAGQKLLDAAVAAGAVVVERDITAAEMTDYQPHQMRKKYSVYDRFQGLADEGRLVPQTERLRIRELAEELTDDIRQQQRQGTRERVRAGKASEPTPARLD